MTAIPSPQGVDDFDANHAADLLGGVKQSRGLGLDQILLEGRIPWSRMKLCRFIDKENPLTPLEFSKVLPVIAKHVPCSDVEVWRAVRTCGPDDPVLLALMACEFWQPTSVDVAALTRQVTAALAPRAAWQYAGRVLPTWLYPVGPRRRCTHSLAASAGLTTKAATEMWRDLFREVSLAVMPVGEAVPINATILILQSRFNGGLRRHWPHDRFSPEHVADLAGALAHDAVRNRGAVIGFVDDESVPLPESLRSAMEKLDTLMVVDDHLLLRRDAGSPVWVTCRRDGSPLHDKFVKQQMLLLAELRRRVWHPLNVESSFNIIIRHLLDG